MPLISSNKVSPAFSLALKGKMNPPMLKPLSTTTQTSTPRYGVPVTRKISPFLLDKSKVMTQRIGTNYTNDFPAQGQAPAPAQTPPQGQPAPQAQPQVYPQANQPQGQSSSTAGTTPMVSSPIPPPSYNAGNTTGGTSGYPTPPGDTTPSSNPSFPGLVNQLSDFGSKESTGVTNARKNLLDVQNWGAGQLAGIEGSYGLQPFQLGEKGILQRLFTSKEGAAQTALSNALESQGQQIGATESAAGLASPGSSTFQVGPGNVAYSALEGGNKPIAATPSQVSPGNALVTPGGKEVYSGLGGLYGLGVAQQNIKQGQDFQGQAAGLDTTLRQIDALSPTLTKFIGDAGLNVQGTPYYNQSINSYIKNVQNPAASVTANAMMADLRTYTAQILGESGLNPTEVSQMTAGFDPGNLNPQQLTAFIENLRNLGQIRLQPIQQSVQSSYGGGTTPFSGAPAVPSTNSALVPDNNNFIQKTVGKSDFGRGFLGSLINTVGGIENFIKGFAHSIFN